MKELAFFHGTRSTKRITIKKKKTSSDLSVAQKIAQRRKTGNWSSSNNEDTTTAAIPNPAQTSQGPTSKFFDRRSKKKVKYLKQFRDYFKERGIE